MSEVKHTPGPWSYLRTTHPRGYIVTGRDGIYDIAIVRDVGGTPENAANARLIAAAPELLEALQGVLKAGRGTSGRIILEGWHEVVVRDAIAKATGERP